MKLKNALLGASCFASAVITMAALTIEELRARQQELLDASQAIVAAADEVERELTDEEIDKIEANKAEVEKIGRQITAREAAQVTAQGQGRRSTPDVTAAAQSQSRRVVVPAAPRDPRGGFASLGEFAQVVRNVAVHGHLDERIRGAAAGTISTEQSGADGGFAVPPEFRRTIMERVFGEASLIGMSDQNTSASNTMTFPIDMTTPWQTTGGIQANWEGETAALTQSKVALEQVTLRLHKLAALVPVSDELLEDAGALNGYLSRKVPEKMDFAISFALAWGNGVGKPLGWMNSPALVTQAAEGGQTADTINANNVVKMYARMPTNSLQSARWFVHPDAWPQLPLMTIGNWPVYAPPSGLATAPFGTLLGRPVIPHQICETVGDVGDIMFVDLQQYMTITKAGGIRSDVSIHLWFDQDLTAYRFTVRVAGQPWWSSTIASRDGTFTQSPFVVLAAR
jgi:HK97 family phage major capsid protein